MSDGGLENDLFGGSDDGAPPQPPSPVASSSRGSPKPEQSGTVTPAVENNDDEDGGIGADLFGDDDDQPASPRRREGTSPDTPVSLRSSRSPNPLEYAEEDVREPENQEQNWVSMPFPEWDKLKPTDGKIWQMRLPAYVNMESTPYDANLFRQGIEPLGEDEDVNVKRSRMISVRNTIRWKWVTGDDGEPKRQSNSRLLRWSDGSVSLQLGSDLYDLAPSYGTTLARASDPPPNNPLPEKPPGANTTFLAYSSSSDEVLMTENTIAGQVSLVPASSSSKTHIELVKHVGQQHVKHSRMKVLDEVVDPEKAHAAVAGGGTKRRTGNRGAGGGGGGGGSRARKLKRDSSDDEEDSRYTYDADAPRRGGARGGPKGFEAEYDEDDGFVVADSDEDGEGEDEEEGDDDGDYGGGGSKKSKAKKRKGSEELDEMEEMERRIEASEREKKRARRDRKEKSRRRDYETDEDDDEPAAAPQPDKDAEGEEEDMDMDVESEED